ncbi:hypothetical protein NHQ30_006270 [Ciborinia camelliae]|nr:hypothetical protein NHQ30_006270 [Ciborinia camelliae]
MDRTLDSRPRDLYSSGYGDFAFAKHIVDGRVRIDEAPNNYLDLDITVDSEFKRSGIFPFYRLPTEIRDKILEEIRRSLLHIYNDNNTESFIKEKRVRIVIRRDVLTWGSFPEEVPVEEPFGRQIAQNLSAETVWGSYPTEERSLYNDFESFKNYYERAKILHKSAATPHPFRLACSSHTIEVEPQSILSPSPRAEVQWRAYIDWIRKALYVSARFRKDLEDVLWRDIELCVYHSNDLPGSVDFLLGRPALGRNLKCVNLQISPHHYVQELGNCLRYMAKNVEIEEFLLTLIVHIWEDGEDLAEGVGRLAYLSVIKNISVTKHFEVYLDGIFYHHRFLDDPEEAEKKISAKITEFLRPHTLQIAEPNTEVERYLTDRARS